MNIIYALIACFIAWIWIDYFRLIEVYGKEKLVYIIITFILGAASTQAVILLHTSYLIDIIPLELNGTTVNDFIYCFLKIGLVEETAKIIPFLLVLLVFRKQFKEPIDFIAFAAISALGFAAAENMEYFTRSEGGAISARAMLTSVSHMFFSALIGYGIVLVKYRQLKPSYKLFAIPAFAFLAIFSHAFYDFWLITQPKGGWVLSLLFFLLTLSWYATILNNSLNNSSTFSYKNTINPDKVFTRIIIYYAIVFIIQFGINSYLNNISHATDFLLGSLQSSLIIIISIAARLSRFVMIQGKWAPIRFEMPFNFGFGGSLGVSVSIKGNSYRDNILNQFYEENIAINGVSRQAKINTPRPAYIEGRLFLKNDESLHTTRVYADYTRQDYELFFLKPKTNDTVLVDNKYPIASLLRYKDLTGLDLSTLTAADFGFVEWVYVKKETKE